MKDKESEKTTMTLNYHKDIELIDNEANKMVTFLRKLKAEELLTRQASDYESS
jgi:hypothetical protein